MSIEENESLQPPFEETFDPNNEAEVNRWGQEQYAEALKYCQKNLLPVEKLVQSKSSVLPPIIAVWYIKLTTKPSSQVWVIGGKVMMDHVDVTVAPSAREALRHFSLSWQMKASTLEHNMQSATNNLDPEQQQKVIKTLIMEAEALYDLYLNDKLWHQG